jgi:hypothetical protein
MAELTTELAILRSVDGGLEAVLHASYIEFRMEEGLARQMEREFDRAKEASRIPIWKHVRAGLVSFAQTMGKAVLVRFFRTFPLEDVSDVRWEDGRLQIYQDGRPLFVKSQRVNISVGEFNVEIDLSKRGLFPEAEAEAFAAKCREVKAKFDAYMAGL